MATISNQLFTRAALSYASTVNNKLSIRHSHALYHWKESMFVSTQRSRVCTKAPCDFSCNALVLLYSPPQSFSCHITKRMHKRLSHKLHLNDKLPTSLTFFTNQPIESMESRALQQIAARALYVELHDAHFWRRIAKRIEQLLPNAIEPKHLAQLLHCFKRMHLKDQVLFDKCMETIVARLSQFTLKDLSKIVLSYAALQFGEDYFYHLLADTACSKYSTANDTHHDPLMQRDNFITWANLLCGLSRSQTHHQDIFERASTPLCTALSSPPVLRSIPHNLIVQLIMAYASFEYKNQQLLSIVSKVLPALRLDVAALQDLEKAFELIGYTDPSLTDRIRLSMRDTSSF